MRMLPFSSWAAYSATSSRSFSTKKSTSSFTARLTFTMARATWYGHFSLLISSAAIYAFTASISFMSNTSYASRLITLT